MKKLFLSAAVAVLGLVSANAQFEAGAYAGAPLGDSDGFSINAGATFSYLVEVVDGLKVGGTAGVDHFFGKEYDFANVTIDGEDATFIPVAASAKYNFNPKFFVGLDLGYAIGVSDGAGDGGFLARPRVGFSLPIVDLYAFYKNISYTYDYDYGNWDDDWNDWDSSWNLGSIGVGASFKF